MFERVVVQGWRSRLDVQVESARGELYSHGANHQGARTVEHVTSFMGLGKLIQDGICTLPRAEPRTVRFVTQQQREQASTRLREVRQLRAEWYDSLTWRIELEARDPGQVRSEKLAIRREDWADRKAEDPVWYSKELAYNAQRRRHKPPPSAKGEDRNFKQRAALEKLKEDPVAYAEFRLKRAEQCRQSRLRRKASDGVSGS